MLSVAPYLISRRSVALQEDAVAWALHAWSGCTLFPSLLCPQQSTFLFFSCFWFLILDSAWWCQSTVIWGQIWFRDEMGVLLSRASDLTSWSCTHDSPRQFKTFFPFFHQRQLTSDCERNFHVLFTSSNWGDWNSLQTLLKHTWKFHFRFFLPSFTSRISGMQLRIACPNWTYLREDMQGETWHWT